MNRKKGADELQDQAIYFDMDGVLCDWVSAYNQAKPNLSLARFMDLNKPERDKIKNQIFTYAFFRNMAPIQKGMDLFEAYRNQGEDVYILSAIGDSNHIKEIKRAKRNWVKEHLGAHIPCYFVDKVRNKHLMKLDGYKEHILIDDRKKAIDAWRAAGGTGILFEEWELNKVTLWKFK